MQVVAIGGAGPFHVDFPDSVLECRNRDADPASGAKTRGNTPERGGRAGEAGVTTPSTTLLCPNAGRAQPLSQRTWPTPKMDHSKNDDSIVHYTEVDGVRERLQERTSHVR